MMKFGIQGGRGSFNESALKDYVTRHQISDYETVFLYTTEKVLCALDAGEIDYGQFAIHNAAGGMVQETLAAISQHNFKIIEEFKIKITHNLMKRKDVAVNDIDTVMAHDQVLKQCTHNLASRYPQLTQIVGEGDLLDTATAAKALAEGKIGPNLFILGNPIIADLFDFETVDTDLQDLSNNLTTFLLVERR